MLVNTYLQDIRHSSNNLKCVNNFILIFVFAKEEMVFATE